MDTLIHYAKTFLGTPYIWGGQSSIPGVGLDCSGFVQIVLQSIGADPRGDQTAQGLHRYFAVHGTCLPQPTPGSLAFYGKSETKITHIAFCIDHFRIIEAGGGNSTTKTRNDAIRRNACVRIRPLKARRDLVSILLPKYKQY